MTFGAGTLREGSTDGSTGGAVSELQQWLIDRGFLIAYGSPTGAFDQTTQHAVKAFQYSAEIEVDGAVGDGTRTAADSFTGTATTSGWHPYAVRNIQQNRSGGSFTTTTRRGVLHTTEIPHDRLPTNYLNPPHFSIGRDGAGQPVTVWQHYPVTVAAKSLAVSETVQTNRHGAIQIEIIGTAVCSPRLSSDRPVPGCTAAFDPELFAGLGQLMRWIENATGVSRVSNHAFVGEKEGAGVDAAARLGDADWLATTGWVGHQHVPRPNFHWDPGLIDIAGLLAVTSNAGQPAPPVRHGPGIEFAALSDGGAMARPCIGATTRQLTNAFPSLTFAVDCAGLPFFEVVLTTDHTLFAPEQSARRTAANFYASRQDGMRNAGQACGRYVAPVQVIRAFADANPAGGKIYYTVVGYADQLGNGAVPAADPAALARTAPSVAMVPGFVGHTMTESLGVPLSMLRGSARPVARQASATRQSAAARLANVGRVASRTLSGAAGPPARVDPAADRAEGEDGYDYRMSTGSPVPDIPPELRPPPQRAPTSATPPTLAAPDSAGYDDGWGAWPAATALDSRFSARQPEPRPLLGVESPSCGADDEYDDLGWAGTAYSDAPAPDPAAPTGTVPPGLAADWRPPLPELTPAQKRDVIEAFVGPDRELYAAVNPDGEYAGRAGTDHPAYQRYHLGLSFGLGGFSQDSGELGQLLILMQERDGTRFAETFGPRAGELLIVTNRPGPLSRDIPDGRSVRVQPVDGADLWDEPWLSRFASAGADRTFQGAQIELAAGLYLDPVLRFAADLGLATERGLAMIFDRVAHRSLPGGLAWVTETVGPLQTPVLLRAALDKLGFQDVESFQRSQPDLLPDDQFGALTHAALTGALRGRPDLVPGSPVPVLSYRQMLDALAQRAAGQPWGDRMVRLGRDEAISDELPVGALAA